MIRFIAKFDVKPSERENFVAALRNVRDGTAREEGALGWDMYVNTDDPNQFWVDERYRDDTAVEFHQSQPYIIALADLSAQALSGPPAGYLLDLPIHSAGQQKAATAQDEPMMLFFIVPMADGTRQQIIDRLDTHVPLTRQEVGNLMFDAFTLRSDPNTVLVHEIWRTPAALWDEHFSQGYAQETGALLSELTGRDLSSLMYVVKSLE